MQRLGKNLGGYRGETIDVPAILAEIRNLTDRTGWHRHMSSEWPEFLAYTRAGVAATKKIYLSAGIHGDEPAGPLAVLELLRRNDWPPTLDIWLCPCLNAGGLAGNTRENPARIDLNRDFKHLRAPEIRAHTAWLQVQPNFDVAFCLHEDWEAQGFYLYELNPDAGPSLAETIIENVTPICPIDHSPLIDGREARAGIIRPDIDLLLRPEWPEAFYLITHKTRRSYTLESASDFPLATRVASHVAALDAAFSILSQRAN